MATKYNTLTLSGLDETQKKKSVAGVLVAGLVVIAVAGLGASLVNGHANSVMDARDQSKFAYESKDSEVWGCMGLATTDAEKLETEKTLPRFDVGHPAEFYNACFYSYSCCTQTTDECMVSGNYGPACRSCLRDNGPKMLVPLCKKNYRALKKAGKKKWALKFKKYAITQDKGWLNRKGTKLFQPWISKDLRQAFLIKKKAGKNSCWSRAGSKDQRMKEYTEKCWDAISWCNMLCPKDALNSNDLEFCKTCVSLDFKNVKKKKYIQSQADRRNKKKAARKKRAAKKAARKAAKKAARKARKAAKKAARKAAKKARRKN